MKTKLLILLAVLATAVYAVEPAKPDAQSPAIKNASTLTAAPRPPGWLDDKEANALRSELGAAKAQIESLQKIIAQLQAQRNQLAATVLDSQIKAEGK